MSRYNPNQLSQAQFNLARRFEQAGLCSISQAVRAFATHDDAQIATWRQQLDAPKEQEQPQATDFQDFLVILWHEGIPRQVAPEQSLEDAKLLAKAQREEQFGEYSTIHGLKDGQMVFLERITWPEPQL